MTTKTFLQVAAPVVGAMLMAGTALAQDAPAGQTGTNRSEKGGTTSATAVAVEQSALAADLTAYGRASKSPVALMLAGQITAEVGAVEQARSKTSEAAADAAPAGDAPAAKQGDRPKLTPAVLFGEARALAGADRQLIAQIDRAVTRQAKGRVGGPTSHYDAVNAGTTDVYNIAFRGGESARLAVIGDGDTDLDLYVYDANGNLICSDTDNTDRTVCGWTPAWTGSFRVKIRNYGRVYNNYRLMTN